MQIFNLLLASLGSAMSLVILVVVLIYYVYLDVKPELARDIPSLWLTAFLFGVVGSAGWLSAWSRAKNLPYKTWIEAGTAFIGAGSLVLLVAIYR